ncbi:MAG: phosphatidylinositol-specific phospholipase C1-like protein [Porticoccaceae bacterium]|nr:phosphatidylinositol-specific phospholipase C1-like protein [Porticoccaceae bacterium]
MKATLNTVIAVMALALLLQACSPGSEPVGDGVLPDHIAINRIQNIGTHNSYHLAPFDGIAVLAQQLDYLPGGTTVEGFSHGFDYSHATLTEQLNLGVRHFEIDIYDDSDGGRFANFGAYPLLREAGLLAAGQHHDPEQKLQQPGTKVFHLPETDFRSTCLLFRDCLQEIRRWSDNHPDHIPVMIQIEPKEKGFPALNPAVPAAAVATYDSAAWKRLEAEIATVFSRDQLLTPDDVRGDYPTVYQAISDRGWPSLGQVRGRVFFTIDNRGSARDAYLEESAKLEGRLLFADVDPGHPAAAFAVINDPSDPRIAERVAQGYLVRTRADANTDEARQNDYRRRDQAFASGAQFITTDYPQADQRFSSYRVSFEGGRYVRVTPAR